MCTTTIVLRLYNYDPNRIAFDRTERYYFVAAHPPTPLRLSNAKAQAQRPEFVRTEH